MVNSVADYVNVFGFSISMKIRVFCLLCGLVSFVLADVSGGFSGGMSTGAVSSTGNNYGSSTSSDTSSSSSAGSTGTNITIDGSSTPAMQNQTQINNTSTGASQKDLVNGYRKDEYNSYQALQGKAGGLQMLPNGMIVPTNSLLMFDEFQANVNIRTGIFLQRYGYNLFTNPGSFIANSNVPVSDDYVLGPNDQVTIRAWGAVDISYTADVENDGSIFIPKIGKINITGVKASNLQEFIRGKVGRIYRNFTLSATVSNVKSIQITVAGFASSPGTYTVSSLSTLTNAVFASGGPSNQGSLRHIALKRNGVVIADYDMYDLLLKGDNSKDIHLISGDIIYIKPHGAQVAIYDGVKVPGIYEARETETISNIVVFAGGYTFNNMKQKIIVEKILERSKINVYNYDFDKGLKQPVENGEIIHFFRMPNRYNDAIVLIGNVANPSRFNWHEGVTVKDIIPSKELLLTKSFWNSYSKNTYAKDQSIEALGREKASNNSGANAEASQYSTGLNSSNPNVANSPSVFGGGENLFIAGPVYIPEADINWHYAVIVRLDPTNYRSVLVPFDLEAAIDGDPKENLKLQAGDVINILSSKDVRSPARKGIVYVFIDGEVNRPGVYEMEPGTNLVDAIQIAAGLTSDAYLYGMELNRQSVKKRQKASLDQMLDNLQQSLLASATNNTQTAAGASSISNTTTIMSQQQSFIDKLKQLKPTGRVVLNLSSSDITLSNLPQIKLENGDTIYIPPTPTTVDVVGQVFNPATFVYDPSNTLDDYINMAGTANNFADTSSIYVLRADGTLYSKQQAGWFGAFGSKRLYAGDAIIVPQKIQFSTITQNLIDWTTILANFGLGVAAINQLSN